MAEVESILKLTNAILSGDILIQTLFLSSFKKQLSGQVRAKECGLLVLSVSAAACQVSYGSY
jgi:hypothetical protein